MDQLACMRVFVRVVEHGAFARAADDLSLSRATVTTAVAALETRLGVRLLQRTTRRLSLTEAGRQFYDDCVRILGELAEAEDKASRGRATPHGRLRISIPQSFESLGILPLLTAFMQQHPPIAVDVVVTDRAVNLVEEGIDCALRGVDIADDALLVARPLFAAHLLTCASPDYLARRGTPRTIAELADHDCIRFVSPSTGRPREWRFVRAGRPLAFAPNGRLSLTSLDAAAEAACAGAGIAQVPDALVHRAIVAGRLQPLLTDHVAPGIPLMLVYPANRYLPAKVRVFADFITEAYPRDGWWPQLAARPALE